MSTMPTEIIGGIRTNFGKFGGVHVKKSVVDLGVDVVRACLAEVGLDKEMISQVILGNTIGTEKILARQVSLFSGLPATTTSLTVDRACCSAMSALSLGDLKLRNGVEGVIFAGGAESMSTVPHLIHGSRWNMKLGVGIIEDPLLLVDPTTNSPAAVDASGVAIEYGIDRAEQDEWALASHGRYFAALDRGFFDGEICSRSADGGIAADEQPRRDTSIAALSKLRTVFGSATVTAGNAPGLNDGATVLALARTDYVERNGLKSLARIVATTEVAGDSRLIASIPGDAIASVLAKAGWQLDDVDLFEVNEAFAAVPLVTAARLSKLVSARKSILDRTNVHGGAVAIGHPVGASGARLVLTLIRSLIARGGGLGVAAICGGSGQGDAIAVEVGR